MYCKECNKEIPGNSEFCPYCGTKVKRKKINGNSKQIISVLVICFIIIAVAIVIIKKSKNNVISNTDISVENNIKSNEDNVENKKIFEEYFGNMQWLKDNLYIDSNKYGSYISTEDIQKIKYYVYTDEKTNKSRCIVFTELKSQLLCMCSMLDYENGYVKVYNSNVYESMGYGINPDKKLIYISPNRKDCEEFDVYSYDGLSLTKKYVLEAKISADGYDCYKDSVSVEESECFSLLNEDLGLIYYSEEDENSGFKESKYNNDEILCEIKTKVSLEAINIHNQKVFINIDSNAFEKLFYENVDMIYDVYLSETILNDFYIKGIYNTNEEKFEYMYYSISYYNNSANLTCTESVWFDDKLETYRVDDDYKISDSITIKMDEYSKKSEQDSKYVYVEICSQSNYSIYDSFFSKYVM